VKGAVQREFGKTTLADVVAGMGLIEEDEVAIK
jgi:hypothetical protein